MDTKALGWIAIGVLITVVLMRPFHVAMRKKEVILYRVKLLVTAFVLYGAGILILTKMGKPGSTVLFGSLLLGLSAKLIVKRPRDSRYISKHVKRAVIARDLGDESEYDSSSHHFDHIVPYSKGGDNSAKNLRLTSKRRNLRRGNKNPRLRDFYE